MHSKYLYWFPGDPLASQVSSLLSWLTAAFLCWKVHPALFLYITRITSVHKNNIRGLIIVRDLISENLPHNSYHSLQVFINSYTLNHQQKNRFEL